MVPVGLAFCTACCIAALFYRAHWITIPDEIRRLGCIDGLRGYLALFVVIQHWYIWQAVLIGGTWQSPTSNILINFGQASVAVFFMITGALFYPRVVHGFVKTDWKALYISRIFRLIPLMWAVTAFVVLIIVAESVITRRAILVSGHDFFVPLIKWMMFKPTDLLGHHDSARLVAYATWSLIYEWQFYVLILPLAAVLFSLVPKCLTHLQLCVGLLVISMIPDAVIPEHPTGFWLKILIGMYLPLFAIGGLGRELSNSKRVTALLRSSLVSAIGLTGLLVEITLFPGAYGLRQYILLGMFFIPCLCGNSYFGLLRQPFSIVLGELSYGNYLLHGSILYIGLSGVFVHLGSFSGPPQSGFLLPFIIGVLICVTSVAHNLVERPGIALGKRVHRGITKLISPVGNTTSKLRI